MLKSVQFFKDLSASTLLFISIYCKYCWQPLATDAEFGDRSQALPDPLV